MNCGFREFAPAVFGPLADVGPNIENRRWVEIEAT
jgi:hypothetical protein